MSDVSCRAWEFFEHAARLAGVDPLRLVEGTHLDLATLRDPRQRVPWDDWTRMLVRFEDLFGGPAVAAQRGAGAFDFSYARTLRSLSGLLLSPRQLYRATLEWVGPLLFRNLSFATEARTGGALRVRITIPAHQRPSGPYFRLARAALAALPRLLDLGDAQVRLVEDGHVAVFDITPPPTASVPARLRRVVRSALVGDRALDELVALQHELRADYLEGLTVEHDLAVVLDGLPDLVAILRGHRLLRVNGAWRTTLCGPDAADPSGRDLLDFVEPRDHAAVLRHIAPGGDGELQFTALAWDGTPIAVEAARPVHALYAGADAAVLVARDVRHRLHTERALARADRLAAIGTLAAGVAHEVNNPLTYVIASLYEIAATLDRLPPELRHDAPELARDAIEGAQRIARIVKDLQTAARGEVELTAPVPTDLTAVLDDALALARPQLRLCAEVVRHDRDAPAAWVLADPDRLGQVVLNLLINASHALLDTPDKFGRIALSVTHNGDATTLTVADTGPGIPPHIIDRVFEPFFTTKPVGEGSGLGLYVCHRLVTSFGGTITLDSRPGLGTEVRVTLPATASPAAEIAGDELEAATPRRTLLVIDDEPMIGGVLARVLRPHNVVTAASGLEALVMLQCTAAGAVDLVLCDLHMPDLDGVALHRRLLAEQIAPPFVFMTGGSVDEAHDAHLRATGCPLLTKPFSAVELHATIEALLDPPPRHG